MSSFLLHVKSPFMFCENGLQNVTKEYDFKSIKNKFEKWSLISSKEICETWIYASV